MGLFSRKTVSTQRPPLGSPVGAVSVRRAKEAGTATAAPTAAASARNGPEMYTGTVIEPESTSALRINSAEDVDANVKKYGHVGVFKGGGGGYGGAGTR